ncbi:MAG TPA: DegT/DnrJ/EryC1/StrS family aminotransferase [Fontimonas sp.]
MSIPQADPLASYLELQPEIDAAVLRAMASGRYMLGPEVNGFEAEFAQYVNRTAAIGVASGTDAIILALRALGVGNNCSVVTVSHTAVATVTAIRSVGATPVLVDVDPENGLMRVDQVSRLLDNRADRLKLGDIPPVKAVVPVHLYGRMVDMPALCALSETHGFQIVEDCAQAVGSRLEGRPAGSWGHCGAFSFYPTKNLGAIGDAGAVVAQDAATIDKVRLLRQYGWVERYSSSIEGMNSRLDEMQAAILRIKLSALEADNLRRREIAARYRSRLRNCAMLRVPLQDDQPDHSYHQFVVRSSGRDALRAHLSNQGIGSLIHYPVPVHRQPAYEHLVKAAFDLQETESWASQVLSLPIYAQLELTQVDSVADAVNAWAAGAA